MAVVTLKDIRQPVGETGAELGSTDMGGGMSVLGHVIPKGVDYTELLRAACGEVLCPVPHHFVVTKGVLGIRYTDGKEETAKAGDVAYTPPGHSIWAIEAVEMVEISPADGNAFLMGRIAATGLLG